MPCRFIDKFLRVSLLLLVFFIAQSAAYEGLSLVAGGDVKASFGFGEFMVAATDTFSNDVVDAPDPVKVDPIKVDTPKPDNVDPSKADAPKPDKADAPKPDKADAPKPDKADAPKPDKADAPKPDKADAPKSDKADTPKSDKADAPKPDKADATDASKGKAGKDTAKDNSKGAKGTKAEPVKEEPVEDSLAQMWSSRASDLATLAKEASTLRANADAMAAPLAASLKDTRTQVTRLSGLFQASRGHPSEQLTMVQQMKGLQERLEVEMRPLEEIAATIAQRLEDLAGLQKDMDDFTKESAAEGMAPISAADATELKNFTRTLADAKLKLVNAATRLEKILAPAKATSKRLSQTLENIESTLTASWRQYYLSPSQNDLGSIDTYTTLFTEWTASFSSRMRFAYPQSMPEWEDAVTTFAVVFVVMALMGLIGLRGARVLSGSWRVACEDVIKGSWIWASFGLAVLLAAANQSGGTYFAFIMVGSLLVIAAVAAMSWRLRVVANSALKNRPSPLNRLLPAASLGMLMLFSDLPPRMLGWAWILVMVTFFAWVFNINRKGASTRDLPLLEKLSYGCALWFGVGSLLMAFMGYARLGILLFMLLFALVNILTLGNALMALFANLIDQIFNKEVTPVRNALGEAIAIPGAWLFSLICTLPWFWAVPGARYLLRTAMAANYTVGDASVDFSRLLLIVLFFFLVRSFVSLSSTSLNHLPDHMPHIERGVIPPLRTMVRYVSWTIFGIIVLGSFGVNFTSLAVVAGGLSVGIGFGVQNLFNNLISGLILIFGRTILVGDVVDVASISGTVKAINIRSTTIETAERALVYVPNSAIMSSHFFNWTRLSRMVRRSITIGVPYGTDPELVTKALLDAAEKQEHVRKAPPPSAYFANFGPQSLEFTLNVFIDDIDNGARTLSAIRCEIEKSLQEIGIIIPSSAVLPVKQ